MLEEETLTESEEEYDGPSLETRIVARRLFIVLAVFIVLAIGLVAVEIVEHLISLGIAG